MATLSAGPRYFIEGPAPAPNPYNLVATAQVVGEAQDGGADRWAGGANVRSYPCPGGVTFWPICPDGTETKETQGAGRTAELDAFTVVLGWQCTMRGWRDAEMRQRLLVAFAAGESVGVERAAWDGFAAGVALGDAPDLPLAAAATRSDVALAVLEQAIAEGSGSLGIIHAPPLVATAWAARQLLVEDAGKLRTRLGTLVVPGYGYSGALVGQAAPAATRGWAVATGLVSIRRGAIVQLPDDEASYVDRSQNVATIYAERDYLVVADTCTHAAVLVDIAT